MKQAVQLNNIPNQSGSFNALNNNDEAIKVDYTLRTTGTGLIINLTINETDIVFGKRCINLMPLISNNEYGGNLYFQDDYGNEDPIYAEFNTRYKLVWDTDYIITRK